MARWNISLMGRPRFSLGCQRIAIPWLSGGEVGGVSPGGAVVLRFSYDYGEARLLRCAGGAALGERG
jgi:hypothetical protein